MTRRAFWELIAGKGAHCRVTHRQEVVGRSWVVEATWSARLSGPGLRGLVAETVMLDRKLSEQAAAESASRYRRWLNLYIRNTGARR